jgi:hypothetical protein
VTEVAAQPSPAPRPGCRRRRPWILLAAGIVLPGCGVGVPVTVIYGVATAADKGADCPSCAATDWTSLMGSLWWDSDGETRAAKDVAADHRPALLAQRRAYIDQIRADARRYPEVAGADLDPYTGTRRQVEIYGDTATVVLHVAARWPNIISNAALWMYSSTADWRFTLHHDNTGWRITALTMPPWCGTYSRCDAPQPPESASPSPIPDDPLATLRPMLPCGPRNPFRQWHSCPPDPGSS